MRNTSLAALTLTFALAASWAGCASSPETAPPSSEVALRTTIVHVDGMT